MNAREYREYKNRDLTPDEELLVKARYWINRIENWHAYNDGWKIYNAKAYRDAMNGGAK
jgi:hypothetical protein